jgi:spore germination protein YaaH
MIDQLRRAARRAILTLAVVSICAPAIPASVAADSTPLVPLTADQVTHRLSHEVFGYLPYWELNDGTDPYLRYDLLTTIAFFGINANSDGSLDTSLSGYKGYLSDRATNVIQHAHALGVRTVVTFQSFGTSKNAAFFTDPAAQATAIQQLVALMQARGADGANVDVELISGTYFPAYGAFLGALRQAALAANPNAQISVATSASATGARMAAAALANGVDRVFMMGYDYRTAGTNPIGSIDPLVRAGGGLSLTSSLDTYASYGVPLDRVILGLPLYGRTWPTVSADLRAARQTDTSTYGGAKVFYPRTLPDSAAGATFDYDPVEQSARLTLFDTTRNTWVQTYYDDPTTLAAKLSLANTRGLAGAGFWALGYDRGEPGYWDTVNDAFGASKLSAIVIDPGATKNLDVAVSPVWQDIGSPTTSIRLSNDGATWSGWLPIAPSVPWHLGDGGPDGMRTVYAQILNASGATSSPVSGHVVVDTTPPTASPPVAAGALHATVGVGAEVSAVVGWAASDVGSGVASTTLEQSEDGAAYVPLTLPTPAARSLTVTLDPGHTYRWRVTPTDAAGNTGTPVESSPTSQRVYDGSTSNVRYSASWRRASSGAAIGGRLSYSSTKNATATFTFTGRVVSLVVPVGPTRGVARVLVDGVPASNVSCFAPTGKARQLAYTRAWSVAGRHTITLKVAATAGHPRVDVDAFVVLP